MNTKEILQGIKNWTAGKLDTKVDKVTGKGLSTNDYTNEEKQKVAVALVPADIAGKADASDVYTKSETYSKTEVNNLITTPNQQYVSVTATAQTTAVTDLLPATGAADTIYRVGNWDGTQYNDSVYSEYVWNGSAYIKLSTKSQVGEVYDISANHADTKYADLAAALGTNGANIPQSLQRGGMSIKFVQSSDNKYVQYLYVGTSTDDADFTNINNWEKTNLLKELNQLGEKLGEFNKTYSSPNVSNTIPSPLVIGRTYTFKNLSSTSTSVTLRDNDNEVIQVVKYGMSQNEEVTITVEAEHSVIFVYGRNSSIQIIEKTAFEEIDGLKGVINSNKTEQSKTNAGLNRADRESVQTYSWESGDINSSGQDSDYDSSRRIRTKGFAYLKKGDQISATDNTKVQGFFVAYYHDDFSFDSITANIESGYYLVEKNSYVRICVYPKSDSSVIGLGLADYINFEYYNANDSVSQFITSKSLSVYNRGGFDFGWKNGNIGADGYENTYDASYRLISEMFFAKAGDIIVLQRQWDEQFVVNYYDDNKNFVSASSWKTSSYKFTGDCFVRILLAYNTKTNYQTKEILAKSLYYVRDGEFGTIDNLDWEFGGIAGADGKLYNSSLIIRSKKIVHIKAGTIAVPYVLGRYLIVFYDNNGGFIEKLPADDGGQHSDGWFSQNAYEFRKDANVRFVLAWMPSASFYQEPGYENIIPNDNTIEHLSEKFRVLPPNYEMPYYIKNAIEIKSREIFPLANMFKATILTDPHEYYYHEKAAIYCAALTSDVLLNFGDLLSWPVPGYTTAIDTLNRHSELLSKSVAPVILSKGNHEQSSEYYLDGDHYENVYNRYMYFNQMQKPLIRKGYCYDEGNENKAYFYYDDELTKTRVICLNLFVNGMHRVEDSQRFWLANQALDLSSKGNDEANWTVIVIGHSQILDFIDPIEKYSTNEERWISDVFKACYNKALTVISDPDTELGQDYIDYREHYGWPKYNEWTSFTPDFSNIKYTFVGYFCGHVHFDSVTKTKDFPHITTTCAHPLENEDKYRREWDTVLEYAIDILCIDTVNKNIILKRIGVGQDRTISY